MVILFFFRFLFLLTFYSILPLQSFASHDFHPNITVSLDGKGDFKSVAEAVKAIPIPNLYRFTIYIKEGVYKELVRINKTMTNLSMIGDGINKTIIIFDRSNKTGFSTQNSATVDVSVSGFLAKDISFINSAGTNKGPAVALRISGDNITCYRCSIEGHQDTLMIAKGNRQFFSECKIYGTTDFIFGYASIIIQNSYIYVRKPEEGHGDIITADGRKEEGRKTGIVLHNCTITSDLEFKPYEKTITTHLGRPWKKYARTIIMESFLDKLIAREGWEPMDNTSNLTTLYYAEYANRGPGASLSGRVKWPKYHVLRHAFTVENFIDGSKWLPQLKVPFIPGLIN